MKIIKMSTGYQSSVERYDLNKVNIETPNLCPGGDIFYTLATYSGVQLVSFYGKELHEPDDPYFEILRYNRNNPLPDVDEFLNQMKHHNIGDFKCRFIYENTVVLMFGNASSTEVELSYPLKPPINILPLLEAVETACVSKEHI